jgi:uncharacterized membrane protein
MAFCPNCGASVEGRFCAKCGTSVGAAPPGQPPPPGPTPGYQQQPGYQQPGAQQYAAPTATSGGLTENVAGALCYLIGLVTGILFLVIAPYNQSKFVRFHAFQAIFFHVGMIGFWIVFTIISFAMPFGLHLLLTLISLVIWLGGIALWLFLMYKAYSNERFKLPIIGDLAEKQS